MDERDEVLVLLQNDVHTLRRLDDYVDYVHIILNIFFFKKMRG